MKKIDLFGMGVASISKAITAQRRLNVIYDFRSDGDKSTAVLIGTPGQQVWTSVPAAPIRGARVVQGVLHVVAGSMFFAITADGTVYQIGTGILAPGTTKVSMSDNFVQLGIVDGYNMYVYNVQTAGQLSGSQPYSIVGNFAQSGFDPDANYSGYFDAVYDYPRQVVSGSNTIDFIDGRTVVDRIGTRQMYASASYDMTDWGGYPNFIGNNGNPVIYSVKENYSDGLKAVDVFNGMIIMWGETSTEFWQDAGTSPNPYARIQGATQKIGLGALWSRATADNVMYFIGTAPDGLYKVYSLNGYTPTPVSDSDIEDYLEDVMQYYGTVGDAVGMTYTVYGHVIYQVSFPTANKTIAYDTKTKVWHEAQTGLVPGRNTGDLGVAFAGLKLVTDYANGNIYQLSDNMYTDNGVPIVRQITSKHIFNDGNSLKLGDIQLMMETGVGNSVGSGSNPQIQLEISRDGGQTFGLPRMRSIGQLGQYRNPRVIWRRNGEVKDGVVRLTMTDPVKFVITSASAEVA